MFVRPIIINQFNDIGDVAYNGQHVVQSNTHKKSCIKTTRDHAFFDLSLNDSQSSVKPFLWLNSHLIKHAIACIFGKSADGTPMVS